jgi:hypothetical protein
MALITQALVTADEVDSYIQNQNATNDTVIEYIINAVSQMFSTYCDRAFITATYTALKLDGNGRSDFYLPNWPVTLLSSIAEDGVALTVDVDFYADLPHGILSKARWNWPWYDVTAKWTTKPQGILVTYTAGYTQAGTLPADLKLAALKEIARQYQAFITKDTGDASRSVQGSSVSKSEPARPEWMEVVSRYRRVRV